MSGPAAAALHRRALALDALVAGAFYAIVNCSYSASWWLPLPVRSLLLKYVKRHLYLRCLLLTYVMEDLRPLYLASLLMQYGFHGMFFSGAA